ncbi:TPA: hypothetical protein DEG21_03785 [Patescibacteria group bacterium]|nr:hypothetical protein [Candidatus Gracilibacteria bacterium]HBY74971.1 hypothetical protein [Candidatus Gracilibacteria bacterium]
MKIDKNSNFLLLISKYSATSKFSISHKLHIVNRKTLEEIQSFDNIVDILQIDNKNDLTCLSKD